VRNGEITKIVGPPHVGKDILKVSPCRSVSRVAANVLPSRTTEFIVTREIWSYLLVLRTTSEASEVVLKYGKLLM
jgi:hypothetical protein